MIRSQAKAVHLLPLLVVLGGCAQLTHDIGAGLDLDAAAGMGAGTHYAEILGVFGPPTKMSTMAGGMAFLYEHVYVVERQYGLILPGEVGKWIKAVYSHADAEVEAILLIIDESGTLRGSDLETWRSDAGAGISMTLIVSGGSLTDTAQYEQSPVRSLDWGKALIQSPFVALNARQNLEIGANGLQLTTNSRGIGQHTLQLKKN